MNRVLGPRYHNINGIGALEPSYLGPMYPYLVPMYPHIYPPITPLKGPCHLGPKASLYLATASYAAPSESVLFLEGTYSRRPKTETCMSPMGQVRLHGVCSPTLNLKQA